MTLTQFSRQHIIFGNFEGWLGNVAECKLPEKVWCSLLTDYYNR